LYRVHPDDEVNERVPGGDGAIIPLLKDVERVAAGEFANAAPQEFNIFIAIRPGGLVKFWFSAATDPAPDLEQRVRSALSKVAVPSVKGQVVVTIVGSVAGASLSEESYRYSPPNPKEWREATRGRALQMPDGLLKVVWPD
jgi:hypothetical protein